MVLLSIFIKVGDCDGVEEAPLGSHALLVHYYSWMIGSGYNYSPADFSTSYWGLDKPTMVGEVTGQGDQHYTPLQFAQACYNNGYIGVLFWVCRNGTFGLSVRGINLPLV